MKIEQLKGWMPVRVAWEQERPFVEWCLMGEQRFTEPFFEQTMGTLMRHPFNLLFRRRTPLETLVQWQRASPGLPPTAFIFHMSRCGSTLVSQMLATLPRNITISEAAPIDSIIRAHLRDPRIEEEERIMWLRAMVSALGQQRHPEESCFFIKFDSWHTLSLPLIHRAFPAVPWIFLYRQPIEVLVSQLKHMGSQMLPGVIEPELLGFGMAEVRGLTTEEYCARVLEKFCRAALQHYNLGGGMLLNYRQLPEAVWKLLPDFFRVQYTEDELAAMRQASRFNAKSPSMPFADDTEAKNRAATDELRRLSKIWLDPLYEQLEALRQEQRYSTINQE
ncbi:MAG TPA: sulfotransferase [Pyrinomonadaceae bacterium]|jgi:hypothetical protein